jgi:hypothetical protein
MSIERFNANAYTVLPIPKDSGSYEGEWVCKNQKPNSVYLRKNQNIDETVCELLVGKLVRELGRYKGIECAPKISVSAQNGMVYLLSRKVEGFTPLYRTPELERILKEEKTPEDFIANIIPMYRDTPNFFRMMAICFLTGQTDPHQSNLGMVTLGEQRCFAKVDHGTALQIKTNIHHPRGFWASCLKAYGINANPGELLWTEEFAQTLEAVAKDATDETINDSLKKGIADLKVIKSELEDEEYKKIFNSLRNNRENLYNLAGMIRLRISIFSGDVEKFEKALRGQWRFMEKPTQQFFYFEIPFSKDKNPTPITLDMAIKQHCPATYAEKMQAVLGKVRDEEKRGLSLVEQHCPATYAEKAVLDKVRGEEKQGHALTVASGSYSGTTKIVLWLYLLMLCAVITPSMASDWMPRD